MVFLSCQYLHNITAGDTEVFSFSNRALHQQLSDLMTPSEKESIIDVSSEWLDDKSLKRYLPDQFSSTIPVKKTKAFIQQEKKDCQER